MKANDWFRPPIPGDLVEVGWNSQRNEPFIGVVTEVNTQQFDDRDRQRAIGCVLVDGNPKWCDLYELKPIKLRNNNENT